MYIYIYTYTYIYIYIYTYPLLDPLRNCNVMLGALKWLGLLCKSRSARLVLLLTGRVVLLADLATAYLDGGARAKDEIMGRLVWISISWLPV